MADPMSHNPPAAADPEDGQGGGAIPGTGPGNNGSAAPNPLAELMKLKQQQSKKNAQQLIDEPEDRNEGIQMAGLGQQDGAAQGADASGQGKRLSKNPFGNMTAQ